MNNEEISDSQDNDLSQVLNELSELREQTQSSLDKFTRLRPFIENEAEYRYPKSEEAKAAEQKLHKMMPLAPMPPDVSGLGTRRDTPKYLGIFGAGTAIFARCGLLLSASTIRDATAK